VACPMAESLGPACTSTVLPVFVCLCLQILQYGRVMRPSLGVVIAPPQALQRIGEKGVLVLDVSSSSHMLLPVNVYVLCTCSGAGEILPENVYALHTSAACDVYAPHTCCCL
jgi:hypothetical protein